jgi:hypothetical protein
MKIRFTKGVGKFDQMSVERNGKIETIDCPKQRIIPHDMVHFAVESTLHKRGFLGRVCAGEAASFQMAAEAESDSVERLVEVLQGDAWSGGTSTPEDMIDLYRVTCTARACEPLSVAAEDMLCVRERIDQLDRQWQMLAPGQTLELEL